MARPYTSRKEYHVCRVIYPVAASSGLFKAIGENEFCNSKRYRGQRQRGPRHFCSRRQGYVTRTKPLTDELSVPVAAKAQGRTRHKEVVAAAGYGQPQPYQSSSSSVSHVWAKKTVGPHCSCPFPYCPGLLSLFYIYSEVKYVIYVTTCIL